MTTQKTDLPDATVALLEQLQQGPTCSVELAASALGVSRGLAYQEARTGSLAGVPVIRIGTRLRVVVGPLREVLALTGEASGCLGCSNPRDDEA